jgi:tetratricopeptide (TPR) repeat protein
MLAVWYLSQSIWATLPPQEALSKGLPLIDKALAIDEEIAEAHAIRAVHDALFERDRESAERSFRRAVELGPNSPAVRGNYCAFFLLTERLDEMQAEARLTKRLDPLSATWNAWASSWIASSGWYDEGLAELEKLVAMDPNHWLPYHELALQYFRGSRFDDALAHGEKAVELSGGGSAAVMQHGCLSYLAGNRERGDELSALLDARARESYVSPSFLAWIRLARGEIGPVDALLEEAARIKDPWLGFLRLLTPSIIPPGPQVDGWIEKYCLPTSG